VFPDISLLLSWLSQWVFPFAVKCYSTNTLAGVDIHQLSHPLVWRVIQISLFWEHPQHQLLHPHLPVVRPETGLSALGWIQQKLSSTIYYLSYPSTVKPLWYTVESGPQFSAVHGNKSGIANSTTLSSKL
jgi:hypothetical protein